MQRTLELERLQQWGYGKSRRICRDIRYTENRARPIAVNRIKGPNLRCITRAPKADGWWTVRQNSTHASAALQIIVAGCTSSTCAPRIIQQTSERPCFLSRQNTIPEFQRLAGLKSSLNAIDPALFCWRVETDKQG